MALGFNSKKVFENEIADLNDDRTDIEFGLGDYIRQGYGALIGKDYSKEALLRGAAAAEVEAINNNPDNIRLRSQIASGLPTLDKSTLQVGKNESRPEYTQRLSDLNNTAAAAIQALAVDGITPDMIDPSKGVAGVQALVTKKTTDNRNKEQDKVTTRADELRFEMYEREDRRDLRQDKQLAQDRALQADTNRMQLQLEYARLDQADRQRAQDRQDKALMTLLQGLGNLGAAFTL